VTVTARPQPGSPSSTMPSACPKLGRDGHPRSRREQPDVAALSWQATQTPWACLSKDVADRPVGVNARHRRLNVVVGLEPLGSGGCNDGRPANALCGWWCLQGSPREFLLPWDCRPAGAFRGEA
jgi:hypothetical protein